MFSFKIVCAFVEHEGEAFHIFQKIIKGYKLHICFFCQTFQITLLFFKKKSVLSGTFF